MSGYRPLLVRARLATGIAHASSWGIGLDGLLAAEVWSRHKLALRTAGRIPPGLHDTDSPADLALPLARCTPTADLWHWAATTAFPENRPTDLPPDVHMWSGRVDHRAVEHLTGNLPAVLSDRQGRYRARRMPLLVTVCSSLTWCCVGDRAAITALLADLNAIGKKRSQGEGQVLGWEVTDLDQDEWTAGHLHPDGTLGRPTPTGCLHGHPQVATGGIGTAGLRPPSMHRARQHTLTLPVSLDQQLDHEANP